MNSEQLYEIIYMIYTDCGIVEFPIDCFEVVRKYDYRIKGYSELSQKKKAACRKLSDDACLIDDTLYYEENAHSGRMRFSIAHELGHAFLKTQVEDDCDRFASHFLAPRILIQKMGHKNAEQIHDTFGLSYAASNRALADYQRWLHCSYYASFQPSTPELLLAQRFIKITPQESLRENCKKRILQPKSSGIPNGMEITNEMLFAHLKNCPQERRKASIHGIPVNEYLMYRYSF
ncbi:MULTISPECIES: ImmA/IrrE family metallo-endopeptidase [Enterocloster]|uniref:ImmA/IrrE family metallo-endopeptidase n=1 Tax=Enterocloster TaxID=2719313 RepID=UPI002A82C59F|nr:MULTISPECIES: ImmA/IrrE family metallo-endopeptidase [Enterocloster]